MKNNYFLNETMVHKRNECDLCNIFTNNHVCIFFVAEFISKRSHYENNQLILHGKIPNEKLPYLIIVRHVLIKIISFGITCKTISIVFDDLS